MFLPIGDSPNFRFTPWVTWSLIALNIVVFLSCYPMTRVQADPANAVIQAYARVIHDETGATPQVFSVYDGFVFLHGFKPAIPRIRDIFSAMFLHGGWLHLIGNMLFLWIYGDNVEYRLGRFGFLLAYLGTGVAAALADGLLRHGSAIPSVGASGAIAGVLGLYFIWFPKNRVRVWVFLFPIFMDVIEFPARFVLGVFLVLDNILPMLFSSGSGGVAHGAHLGGFAGGLLIAVLMDRFFLRRPGRVFRAAVHSSSEIRGGSIGASSLVERLEDGDLSGAMGVFAELPKKRLREHLDPGDGLRLGLSLEGEGHFRAALSVYQRLSDHHLDRVVRAAARLGQARILLRNLNLPVEAYQQLSRAMHEGLTKEYEKEAGRLLKELHRRGVLPKKI